MDNTRFSYGLALVVSAYSYSPRRNEVDRQRAIECDLLSRFWQDVSVEDHEVDDRVFTQE